MRLQLRYILIANRQFLVINKDAIPVDSITRIDFNAHNGGSDNCVCIHTNNPEMPEYYYNHYHADQLRVFLGVSARSESDEQ